jgi:hypothetical protein
MPLRLHADITDASVLVLGHVVKRIVKLRLGWNVSHQVTSSPRAGSCGLECRQDGRWHSGGARLP